MALMKLGKTGRDE